MREIKFRGKRVKEHEYQYMASHDDPVWAYGSLLVDNDCYSIVNDHGGFRTVDEVHPETVGQFTGLRDKNGVEIYEGDIVRINNAYNVTIAWDFQGLANIQKNIEYAKKLNSLSVEVIGNVHQHPELLK